MHFPAEHPGGDPVDATAYWQMHSLVEEDCVCVCVCVCVLWMASFWPVAELGLHFLFMLQGDLCGAQLGGVLSHLVLQHHHLLLQLNTQQHQHHQHGSVFTVTHHRPTTHCHPPNTHSLLSNHPSQPTRRTHYCPTTHPNPPDTHSLLPNHPSPPTQHTHYCPTTRPTHTHYCPTTHPHPPNTLITAQPPTQHIFITVQPPIPTHPTHTHYCPLTHPHPPNTHSLLPNHPSPPSCKITYSLQ